MQKVSLRRAVPFYGLSLGLHLIGLVLLVIAAQAAPKFWGLGLLAYTLGLRHAFDADHISAIDNTVRRLLNQGTSAYGVGWYFSMGHSTVVFLMIIAVRASWGWAKARLTIFGTIGGQIGTWVSGMFLIIIAISSFMILGKLWRLKAHAQSDQNQVELGALLDSRGFLTRFLAPLFRWIRHDWQMYFIGFVFGLGFDTATEIAVIALSAVTTSASTVTSFGIFALPILFAAGMNLMDTVDSTMMLFAYSWAFDTPGKKLRYNLVMTSFSAVTALSIGAVELLQTVHWPAGMGRMIANIDMGWVGYALVLIFAIFWAISFGRWSWRSHHLSLPTRSDS
ncbi:HoxN/HupN/NixA family nickel/cobalt transporter [Secundilactobacillus kimchicus]|uniref:HoxN/HupN/NixA family nickel/cobalt transporter n=1 Tax=Secundilactobacillus kimchicus TaxID=528209 RepID=UPI001C02A907|nr:HoxN/HupN/NixA family nickel/cobalt transporter [Secundilactobacillus kimchicus]MBT9671535.1 HoxN/HupN/NixA family nickel/cobalt transporter [Secundilactobacillus kimchicus]